MQRDLEIKEATIQTFVRVNARIRVPEVRCIDVNGEQIGVIPTREALSRATQAGLDLVEISPNARPPVCRIMDYGKYKYEEGKKEKIARRHQAAAKVKEIQFHPNVGDHDYQTKVRHTREFLEEGHRVKVILFFRGRESAHRELGFEVMNRVISDTQDIANAEQLPKQMGRSLQMVLCARPGVKNKSKVESPAAPAESNT